MVAFEFSINSNPWKFNKYVLPQHTDHAGVMWHGSYLSWLEECRVETLGCVGIKYHELSLKGYELPVASLSIEYKKSLNHGDLVVLETFAYQLNKVRWRWETHFLRDGKTLAAKSKVELVLVSKIEKEFKIIRDFPDFLKVAIEKISLGPG